MPRIIGYQRGLQTPSTAALEAIGCDEIFTDRRPGASVSRPGLERALAAMRPGDVLTVTRLGAIAHDVRDLAPILLDLQRRGFHFRSLDDLVDTEADQGRFYRFAAALLNLQLEARAERRERFEEAARPGEPGRPPAISDAAWAEIEPLIRSGKISRTAAAERLGVDRTTVFRKLKAPAD